MAGLIAALALAACGSTHEPASANTSPAQSEASISRPAETTAAPTAEREVHEFTGFISPTGNVACMIGIDLARCDIIDRAWSPPPRPADCEFDYGQGIEIIAGRPPSFVCAGDTAFGAEEVLAYGDAITAGPLRCESAESGVTCRDSGTGHGFSLGRAAYRFF